MLVTGATGFVGTNLVRSLTCQGELVRILRRHTSNTFGLEGLPIQEYYGDLLDLCSVRNAVKGCTRIFHLAAPVHIGPFGGPSLRHTHLKGTDNLVRAALDEGVERFVFTSSGVTVGFGSRDCPATEQSNFDMADLRIPYIDVKKEAEEVVLDYVAAGLPAIIVNPGYIFGPWDKSPKLNQLLILAAKGRLIFYFEGGLSVVDVADVVKGHLLAMEHGTIGERYILSNQNVTYQEFFTILNAFVRKRPPRFRIPLSMLLAGGFVAEGLGKLLGLNPSFSSSVARLYSRGHYMSSEKASLQLGYSVTPIEHSLERTFSWLKQHGYTS